ncbi:ABC transporter substrate-binding protein [Neorhizobium sp. T786]|uniref:ABC transporter substrate-binding protein n=1 Tax=Pseudorhizobium xiangyangii TaxID=2883104 RepID=UPI001D0014A0|nr:ABC transporter substrate-binding protein [Neorhizobium xiangyangii]MCB5204570.1 ABC transporter substrate-binding protein [Neorhizobium xiangyangii]
MKLGLIAAFFAALPVAAVAAPTSYPLRLENCGTELSVAKAPQRAVGLGQNSTEIMLMLGLAERMAGSAIWVSPVLPELAAENAKVDRIADSTPNFEAVVAKVPDFIAVQFLTSVGPQGRVGTRQQFEDLGVPSYVSPTDCVVTDNTLSDGTRSQMLTMDLLYQEIDELSRIFDIADRGQALIGELKVREEAVRQRVADKAGDVSLVYWFSSPEVAGDAWVAGKNGASGYITEVLGAHNIIQSEQEWPLVGWEAIAAKNPAVIVIGTMDRRTQGADDPVVKKTFLTSDPVVSKLDAVENGRIVEMDAQAMNPTIRTITGLETVADALDRFGLLK